MLKNQQHNILSEWMVEFEAAAKRSLKTRMRYSFIHTYKPVLDDAPYRSFENMAEYPEMVRGKLARLVGLWDPLSTVKPRKFEILLPVMPYVQTS